MDQRWQIELFGWLRATRGDQVVARFRTQKASALLAYLAYHQHRSHPREWLIELLWPESDAHAGRVNLRTELASLRRRLEPPDTPAGAVLLADRATLRLNPAACVTDVGLFEAALRAAKQAGSPGERAQHLTTAAELYRGELLPGRFEEWVLTERQRLAEAFTRAVHELVELREKLGDVPEAVQWARRAVAADPLAEENHHRLIRLLIAGGQIEAARAQFEHGEELLQREVGSGLSTEIRALIRDRAPSKDRGPTTQDRERTPPCRPAPSNLNLEPLPAGTAADRPRQEEAEALCPHHAPRTAAPPSDNLPLRFSRFFGREREITQLRDLVTLASVEARLVTLMGPGGTGKTRLAIQVAQELRDTFPGGVWFVSLRELIDPSLIPDQLLLSLRLRRSPHSDAIDQVAQFLSRAPALLILDNYEHLVESGARTTQQLLEQVEHLKVLVTSRQRLGLVGEREFPVAPLPVPGDSPQGPAARFAPPAAVAGMATGDTSDLAVEADPSSFVSRLSSVPSVALFVDRAQAARPDFQVTARNAGPVAALCQRLEGLPLAIELAAARANVLTPRQMLSRLDQRFELLVGQQRSADPRHRSLRATLDWSYQLLPPELQRFFVRLSIFRGGWTLDAAEVVCDEPRALEYLDELQRCSLVVSEVVDEEMRYCLLETLREYGAAQLTAEEWTALTQKHLSYFVALVEQYKPPSDGPTLQHELDRFERELDNQRAALDWMIRSGAAMEWLRNTGDSDDDPVYEDFIPRLSYLWLTRGYLTEGRQRLAEILSLLGESVPSGASAWLLERAGELAHLQGDLATAETFVQSSLEMYQQLGTNTTRELGCRLLLAILARDQGDYSRARSLYQKHAEIAREIGAESEGAASLIGLGYTAFLVGDFQTAQSLLDEALKTHRAMSIPDRDNLAWICTHLGELADAQGDYASAVAYLEESLTIWREEGDRWEGAWALDKLGWVALHQGNGIAAGARFSRSLAIRRRQGDERWVVDCLEGLAAVANGMGELERAARLFGAAASLRQKRKIVLPPALRAEVDRGIASVRAGLSETAFAAAWAGGQALPIAQAIDEAFQVASGC